METENLIGERVRTEDNDHHGHVLSRRQLGPQCRQFLGPLSNSNMSPLLRTRVKLVLVLCDEIPYRQAHARYKTSAALYSHLHDISENTGYQTVFNDPPDGSFTPRNVVCDVLSAQARISLNFALRQPSRIFT